MQKLKSRGYGDFLVKFIEKEQLCDAELWGLFVNQYRLKSDSDNCWRGEYWGKMMRGACLTYNCTNNEKLYRIIQNSVLDLISTQDELGRITTYPLEKEFNGWDMWVRKYVMLGLIYFHDICKSKFVKKLVLNALTKHANYIINNIGTDKKSIFDTTSVYGGLNSCSILEPFVKLFSITEQQKYYDFATYIVKSGFCKDMNLIDICNEKKLYPYQFKFTKAYEMMSCFNGLICYYKISKNIKHLNAVKNFIDMVYDSDITIIGSAGCTHELFDNSKLKQAEQIESVMQETCVTVTWIDLCYNMMLLSGESKYADMIERSALNAMYGAVNNEKQTMKNAQAMVYKSGEPVAVEHESYPFDSYSPLTYNKRGRKIGGFKKMQNGRSYGCCACIGSAGVALSELFSVSNSNFTFYINNYQNYIYQTNVSDENVKIKVSANLFKSDIITVKFTLNSKFKLALRKPSWTEKFIISCPAIHNEQDGYYYIEHNGDEQSVSIRVDNQVKVVELNSKYAFSLGAYVLALDSRLNSDINKSISLDINKKIVFKPFFNNVFSSNVSIIVYTKDDSIVLCDYAQAGKNYDDENSVITVWINKKTE